MPSVLLRPFMYLTIRHKNALPAWVNWVLPLVISALLVWLTNCIGYTASITSDNGLVSRVLGFVQSLAGFYIAALAAIATFSSKDMDKNMPGEPPTMGILYNGVNQPSPLNRRRFLSQMFAYLTALSFLLSLLSVLILAVGGNLQKILPVASHWYFKQGFLFVYFFAITQLSTITLWGLFYLGERIHTPDN